MSKNTEVDNYWNKHTVAAPTFENADHSIKYLNWRSLEYPSFHDLMELYNADEDWTVVDYGCGPGNDLVGYSHFSKAKKIIGVDISEKALNLAKKRLLLHDIDVDDPGARVRLIQVSDAASAQGAVLKGEIEDESVDHIYCQGVLHHTTDPGLILKEFSRILKKGRKACIMVYNRNSIFYHLYVGYIKRVGEQISGTAEEVFQRSTDGIDCPISRTTIPEEHIPACEAAGFLTEYRGGYLSALEVDLASKYFAAAKSDYRCAQEHRDFLEEVEIDYGLPYYRGKLAGIGGVYLLTKTGE